MAGRSWGSSSTNSSGAVTRKMIPAREPSDVLGLDDKPRLPAKYPPAAAPAAANHEEALSRALRKYVFAALFATLTGWSTVAALPAVSPADGGNRHLLCTFPCRVSRVVLPQLFLAIATNLLDRTALSFAALQMNADLQLSTQQ